MEGILLNMFDSVPGSGGPRKFRALSKATQLNSVKTWSQRETEKGKSSWPSVSDSPLSLIFRIKA